MILECLFISCLSSTLKKSSTRAYTSGLERLKFPFIQHVSFNHFLEIHLSLLPLLSMFADYVSSLCAFQLYPVYSPRERRDHAALATPIPVERGVHGRTIPVERPGRGGRDVAWSPKPLLLSSPGRCGRRQPERPPSLFRLRCRIGFNCGSRRPRLLRSSPQRPASSSHLAVWRATGSPCGDQVGKEEEYCFSGWEANGDAVVVQS